MTRTKPNLPETDVKMLIASDGLGTDSVNFLKERGAEVISVSRISAVDGRIAHHTDLGACLADPGVLFVCPSHGGYLRVPGVEIVSGASEPAGAYPDDCRYNVCIIGRYAVHNFKYTDRALLNYLSRRYDMIDVSQGYAKCMISVVNEKRVITQDKGIAVKLERSGFDVLHIEEKNIRLEGFPYGFIGGATFLLNGKTWCINGSLDKLNSCYNIENMLTDSGVGIVCLNDDYPADVGSFIQIFEEERCYEKKP